MVRVRVEVGFRVRVRVRVRVGVGQRTRPRLAAALPIAAAPLAGRALTEPPKTHSRPCSGVAEWRESTAGGSPSTSGCALLGVRGRG